MRSKGLLEWVRACMGANLIFSVLSLPAQAHDTWLNGKPIPEWVKMQCCGDADAHRVAPDFVYREPCGDKLCHRVEGLLGIIPPSRTYASQDGEYWAFYITSFYKGRWTPGVFVKCFFAPIGQ